MCMEDIRIGRRKNTACISLTNAAATKDVAERDSKRTHIFVGPQTVAVQQFNFNFPNGTIRSIIIPAGGHPLDLDVETVGDLVQQKITYTGDANTAKIDIFLTHLEEE